MDNKFPDLYISCENSFFFPPIRVATCFKSW